MANEKRLIDANAYKASLTKWKDDAWEHNERHDAMLIADCLRELELMPTVDAVEVVHSEWIMVIDENDCECIECPLCGEQFYDGDNDTFDKPYNYCPNCGAKMEVAEDGNE